ncbi:RNA 2',3'-cyclic phosphodiesterase [Palleronia sp. LCG004]|uniref:RNA 2',3'-cyclic phosphodiesterase n=1 Tax=Palleronia sp. LCG004 TaxID=3079304 RepID=UPI002942F38D|nr:RNA 2',3'-cyclic phosphodiesterase [Palleronia sp. LCG004]WOI55361.1 RNA 2',3'-cyclic phosphodiesterase [Palleronia sp. LCG004]
MRIFVALDLPDELTGALSALQDRLLVGRHVPEDDLHLTLAFLPEIRLPELDELALDFEMMSTGPLAIGVAGLDIFGGAHPRSVHATVTPSEPLAQLQGKVSTLIRRAGLDLPHRRFVPHVTLARFPNTMPPEDHARLGRFLQAHGDWSHEPVLPEALTIYQSRLRDDGPVYDPLLSRPLI